MIKNTVRIMPCLDMKNGRVVKGIQFVNLKDAGDPVECARAYCAAGADELAMLEHFHEAVQAGATILLAASVFHFGIINILELKQFLRKRGVDVSGA